MKKYFAITILILGIFAGMTFLPKSFGRGRVTIFQIEKGQSLKEISINLEKRGIIWFGPLFRVYSFFQGTAGKLQAGCYFLTQSMNTPQITEILSSGLIAKEKITIPEGFTSAQIQAKLQNVTRGVLLTLSEYEGYLFPDTYEIPYCMEQEKIIRLMRDNFNRKTANLPITPEIITMASIIEKEVRTKEDREIVSGILWKRIKTGIPLESCATIAYIKGVDQWRYSYEDTRIESSYNTYLHLGLPPGPISNPGLESIEAAVFPKQTSYWYFLSTPEGKTIFSKTLEEHNIAKSKYLK